MHSLKIDNGSSDTCPALNGPNLLRADLLLYCLTNCELKGGRVGSLISLFTGHESYPEYLLKGFAGDSQGFFIPNFAGLLLILLISAILVLELLLVRFRSKQLPSRDLLWSNKHDLDAWALGFAKISQVYERFCQNLEPGVPAGKTRIRWKCVSWPVHF